MKTIRTVPEIWELWKALRFLKKFIVLQRQLKEYRNCSKAADIRTNYEIAQKQIEVDLLNQQKTNQKTILISSLIFFSAVTDLFI
jgi:hypothetical protein